MKINVKMKGNIVGVLLLCFVVLTACSDNSKETENGDFPIPYPEGGEVITDKWDGQSGHRTIKYSDDRHAEILSFYDDYASDSGWNRTETGSGSEQSVIYLNLQKGYTIDVGPPSDHIAEAVVITLWVAE